MRKPFTKRREWLEARGLYKPPRSGVDAPHDLPRKRGGKRRKLVTKPAAPKVFDWRRKYRIRMLGSAKTNARDRGVPFDLRHEDIIIPERCPVFGVELRPNFGGINQADDAPSLDRIIPEYGYVRWNVRVISWKANRMKRRMSSGELLMLGNWLKREETIARRKRTLWFKSVQPAAMGETHTGDSESSEVVESVARAVGYDVESDATENAWCQLKSMAPERNPRG
jgi:hypothetical protein